MRVRPAVGLKSGQVSDPARAGDISVFHPIIGRSVDSRYPLLVVEAQMALENGGNPGFVAVAATRLPLQADPDYGRAHQTQTRSVATAARGAVTWR
jgi:hypothetical protein